MRRCLCCLFLFVLLSLSSSARDDKPSRAVRQTLHTVRANLKAGSSLAESEVSLRTLLADSANCGNVKIWLLLFDAIRAQYAVVNENLYLRQESDTAAFYTHTLHLFSCAATIDSLTAGAPPRSLARLYSFLAPLSANLYGGGGYFLRRGDYSSAAPFFATSLSYGLRDPSPSSADSVAVARAAYWALFCAYKECSASAAEKYAPLALKDSTHEERVLQYLADLYGQCGDTLSRLHLLEHAVTRFPTNRYFFHHLSTYYRLCHDDGALHALSSLSLSADSTFLPALVAESAVLFRRGDYEECISLCETILSRDPSLVAPYIDAGLAYYNLAVPLSQKRAATASEQRLCHEYYIRALPLLEECRQRLPSAVDIWGPPLYDIYLNLNMGESFEEIATILTQ